MNEISARVCIVRIKMTHAALLLAMLAVAAASGAAQAAQGAPFTHPGMLHGAEDLERIRRNVKAGVEPWAGAWRAFLAQRTLDKDYRPHPLEVVGRGVGSVGQRNISNDATAAYNNAIAWTVSGDEAYAKKAIEILNAWAGTCKTVNGKDAVLCAGIYGYKLVNAAEIIRSTYKKWPEQEIEQFKRMMQTAFYPVIQDFSPFANGNWDTACLPTVMSLGIFLDDRAMFDRAVAYFMDGAGDGTLTHYIVNEAGQCQESGRDQGHTQVGIGHLASACEIGWHQGLDMYGFANRRLLQGFEYTAQYNLGGAVPFEVNYDRTGKYNFPALSALSRYRLAPLYEMVYHHYQNRMGIAAPFTAQAAARRPEGSSIDLPGNGTLLFTLPPFAPAAAPTAPPASPGPIVAKGSVKAITLAWVAARAAESYTVQRSERSGGPYEVIAQDIRTTTHTDAGVAPGRVYHYVVSAANAAGAGPQTLETAAGAGLPVPWRQQDVGGATPRGETLFDGRIFTLEGAGSNIGGAGDQFQFAHTPLDGDGELTARYVPQVSSQFSCFGLMMRASLTSGSAHAALLLMPVSGGRMSVETPGWYARLLTRSAEGAVTSTTASSASLAAPYVTWGRLTGACWMKLARAGDTFTASISEDGKRWTTVGRATLALPRRLEIGLAACSRLERVTTRVVFDNVCPGHWK